MMSHLVGAAVRVDMQELTRLQRLAKSLTKRVAEAEIKARRLSENMARAYVAEQERDILRARIIGLEQGSNSSQLQQQVEQYAAKLAFERLQKERMEKSEKKWKGVAMKRNDDFRLLEQQLAQMKAERDTLEKTLKKVLLPECAVCEEQNQCANDVNLYGCCVLYVGGRAKQCAHFRALVERQNGSFIHHDGGLENGRLRLGTILSKADVVLCPLDCVSHDAVNRVKLYCKRHKKRLVFLPTSSLAAFTKGLTTIELGNTV